ncbi:MAG TPA: hypothetical protein DEF51_51405 [Myxococcales bacterium]|nr:hypothetical protein [Myxococcales bacterium]
MLKSEAIADAPAIFRPQRMENTIVVQRELADAMKAEGFTGLYFTELASIKADLRASTAGRAWSWRSVRAPVRAACLAPPSSCYRVAMGDAVVSTGGRFVPEAGFARVTTAEGSGLARAETSLTRRTNRPRGRFAVRSARRTS